MAVANDIHINVLDALDVDDDNGGENDDEHRSHGTLWTQLR